MRYEEITILKKNFSSIFGEGSKVYICEVSLGMEIEDDNCSGEVDPMNTQIPFFIGIYHDFLNYCKYIKYQIDTADKKNQEAINDNKAEIEYQMGRWLFTNYDRINNSERKINEAKEAIAKNKKVLQDYKKLLGAVENELMRLSNDFTFLESGNKKDFTANEACQF